jgi:hypothetical protein
MRLLERASEFLHATLISPQAMETDPEKTALAFIFPRNNAVVVQLDERASEPVAIGGARDPLDFELENDFELLRIDDRTQSAADRVLLGQRRFDIR